MDIVATVAHNHVALRMDDIMRRCDRALVQRGMALRPRLRRVDKRATVWLFDVPGIDEPTYRVRLKAVKRPPIKQVTKLDVLASCTCPFWRYSGPEHWARYNDYLFGPPVGTATTPNVRDPHAEHWACKHVLSVFEHVTKHKWDLPDERRR